MRVFIGLSDPVHHGWAYENGLIALLTNDLVGSDWMTGSGICGAGVGVGSINRFSVSITLKVSAGVSLLKVASWCGHRTSVCEESYAHLIPPG
jgi:hypothetical protein